MTARPPVWQMLREAIDSCNGRASYADLRAFILRHYGDVNQSTITAQTIVCTVNHLSRIHYPENKKPRPANTQYDFLFTAGRGQVELYDPEKHGIWEIRQDELGKLIVAQVEESADETPLAEAVGDEAADLWFRFESHLRDFIARNISQIPVNGKYLQLYVNDIGQTGVEYKTDVGRIDLLAIDEEQNFVIFELKLERGPDSAFGQLRRYMNWVKIHMAQGRQVSGVIVANRIDKKLKYAAYDDPNITLFECQIEFNLNPVGLTE